jgi:Ca2+-binding EF-hand superfamily protein
LHYGVGWFTPAAEAVFGEMFSRFDRDADGALDNKEIQLWANACNSKPFTQAELDEIRDNLDHNKEGNLSLKGFLNFYLLQSSSHPKETWKDLKKLGYTKELKALGK